MEVWQLPSPATPAITAPVRIAGLRGALELVEHRVTRRLKEAAVPFQQPALHLPHAWSLPEELALTLGLLRPRSHAQPRQSSQRRRRH